MDTAAAVAPGPAPGPGCDLVRVDLGPGVVAGFTRRPGGVSTGAWSGLDLGLHVDDDPEHVAANRRLLAGEVGAPVVFARQVHGTRVATVTAGHADRHDVLGTDLGADEGGHDALVTAAAGTALGVLVADCVPVLLADPDAGVVATAHAGRPGLLAGVLDAVLDAMVAAGARASRVRVALGPSVGGCCYEVPAELLEAGAAILPAVRARTTWGTPAMDLRAGCTAVLARRGVGRVTAVGGCTLEDEGLYSYRRARVTGRFAGAVMMAP